MQDPGAMGSLSNVDCRISMALSLLQESPDFGSGANATNKQQQQIDRHSTVRNAFLSCTVVVVFKIHTLFVIRFLVKILRLADDTCCKMDAVTRVFIAIWGFWWEEYNKKYLVLQINNHKLNHCSHDSLADGATHS